MRNKYPKLFQFLGCYFHQDWMCDSSDPDGIIRIYIADSVPQNIEAIKEEISTLLSMNLDEENLREFIMDKMPCNYCYWLDWESGTAWLNHIVEILSGNGPGSNEH
ncbi:contact-dependent growth inhibition system immunity protein [Pseudomonas sp. R151218B TE3479]